MNIVCVICTELFMPSDEIVHTECRHIFHAKCLSRWFQTSETCPYCRESTTQSTINKIYLSFSDNITNLAQLNIPLQDEINNLTVQVKMKDESIKVLKADKGQLQELINNLTSDITNLNNSIADKDIQIYALMEETKSLKQLCEDMDTYKKKIEGMEEAIENLKNFQASIDKDADEKYMDEEDDTVVVDCDIEKTLANIAVIKKNMITNLQEKRRTRDVINKLYQDERNRLNGSYQDYIMDEENDVRVIDCDSEKALVAEKEKLTKKRIIDLLKKEVDLADILQRTRSKYVSNEISSEKQNSLKVCESNDPEVKSNEMNENVGMLGAELNRDNSIIVLDSKALTQQQDLTMKKIKLQHSIFKRNCVISKENITKKKLNNLKKKHVFAHTSGCCAYFPKFTTSARTFGAGPTYSAARTSGCILAHISTSAIKQIERLRSLNRITDENNF